MAEHKPTIIIKKIKKGGHGGHHGGAWKVAYADFVTAMMAFFLLMWLLNASSEEQKRGISNYFGPAGNMVGAGGSGGVLGGISIESEGQYESAKDPATTVPDEASKSQASGTDTNPIDTADVKASLKEEGTNDGKAAVEGKKDDKTEAEKQASADNLKKEEAAKIIQEKQNQMFREAEHMIKKAIQEAPELKDLANNLMIDNTPEGLRIQIVDKERFSMFSNGKAVMFDHTKKLLQKVSKVIERMPNKISITGHTDSKPFAPNSNYSNWELSTDRANATRRELLLNDFPLERLMSVVGKADRDPLEPNNPEDDQNRRISIVLLRNP